MPWGDRTGPLGLGPRTGRGLGYCSGYPYPGYMNPIGRGWWGFGRGRGWFGGWGRGWRHRHWFYATGLPGWARAGYPYAPPWVYPYGVGMSPEQEAELLAKEAELLKKELDEINKRIKTLEKERKKEEE